MAEKAAADKIEIMSLPSRVRALAALLLLCVACPNTHLGERGVHGQVETEVSSGSDTEEDSSGDGRANPLARKEGGGSGSDSDEDVMAWMKRLAENPGAFRREQRNWKFQKGAPRKAKFK